MSPWLGTDDMRPVGFPRVSGDEPNMDGLRDAHHAFSPRERG